MKNSIQQNLLNLIRECEEGLEKATKLREQTLNGEYHPNSNSELDRIMEDYFRWQEDLQRAQDDLDDFLWDSEGFMYENDPML